MNLLLLLSALLSALTGVGVTAREPQQARVAAEAASVRPVEAARPSIAARPATPGFSLVASAAPGIAAAAPLVAYEPIWASRRRE